jgi:hypothetical protein
MLPVEVLVFGRLTAEDKNEKPFSEQLVCPVQSWLFPSKLFLNDPTIGPGDYMTEYYIIETEKS